MRVIFREAESLLILQETKYVTLFVIAWRKLKWRTHSLQN